MRFGKNSEMFGRVRLIEMSRLFEFHPGVLIGFMGRFCIASGLGLKFNWVANEVWRAGTNYISVHLVLFHHQASSGDHTAHTLISKFVYYYIYI